MRYVDLSVTLNAQTPVYPGDPATKIEPAGVIAKDGYTDHLVSFGNHTGTHIDAPLHMVAGGNKLDAYNVERFVGPGKVIDVREGFNFETVKAANLAAGDIVLFCTGMSVHYHEPVYFEDYPAMSKEIADYLVAQKVSMIGVDASSVDIEEDFPIHKTLLGGDVLIIENLTNLESLIGKSCKIYALPIKLDVDAAPARVIAEIDG